VRSPSKTFAGVCLATALLTLSAGERAQTPQISSAERLHSLVTAAQDKRGWPALRQFAESASESNLQDQAFFALGYRQYEANEFRSAAEDLKRAAHAQFVLADYAEYYAAAAASAARQPQTAVDILDGFTFRHPESVLRFDALALFADSLLQAGQADRAIQALTAEPVVRQRPHLESILGRAYLSAEKWGEAARSFQMVYYSFPTSPEARSAGEELDKLRERMGPARFPAVTEELETTRAETLMLRSKTREALNGFSVLLKEKPTSAFAPRWKIGRARCWLHLKQVPRALDQLEASFRGNPSADAERLGVLVEAYVQRDNQDSMDLILDQLRKLYPQSPSYASALEAAGNHLIRKGDWQAAARCYKPLAELFPDTQSGQEASFRVGWSYYLQGDNAKARNAFVNHATRYPTSPHIAAEFFWLGKLAEKDGNTTEARTFYDLVVQRWTQSYYAEAATRRLMGLIVPSSASAQDPMGVSPLASELAQKVPPPASPVNTCPPDQPLPVLRSFSALTSIGLDDLALQYLKDLLRERPSSTALFIALSRFEAEKGEYNPSILDAGRAIPIYSSYHFSDMPRETWTLLFPTMYWTLVEQEAHAKGIDPYLVMGLIRQESAFDPEALSKANARGLMQILPSTARTRKSGRGSGAKRLYEPEFNVKVGTEYLQQLLETNHGVFEQAMAAYHAGQERVSKWMSEHTLNDPEEFMESIPIPATRIYVEKVVRDAAIYRKLMSGTPVFKKCG
jgi:soluble lytic murein transglycosylase